jgi:hypothetical protein
VWSDGLLNQWVNEAIEQLALDLPKPVEITMAALPGVKEYSLSDYVSLATLEPGSIDSVECPHGKRWPRGDVRQFIEGIDDNPTALYGTDKHTQIYANCWDIQVLANTNPVLVFRYAPVPAGGPSNQQIVLWARGFYSQPPSDSYSLDIMQNDDLLLVWWVCGRAISWLAEQRGKRGDQAGAKGRTNASYYERLYSGALKARRRGRGIQSGTVRLVG